MSKIYLIGIGYKPFDKKAREIISNSQVIIASNRLFEVFKRYEEFEAVKEKVRVINDVDKTINFIRSSLIAHRSSLPIVLLSSGDPMFFSLGRRTIEEFGKDKVEILPDLSSIQMAFARIKEPWDDAFLISLHQAKLSSRLSEIPALVQTHNKIAILTSRKNNPGVIAKEILESLAFSGQRCYLLQPSVFKMFVCERLGYPDERVVEGRPEEIAHLSFAQPNVVIIKKDFSPALDKISGKLYCLGVGPGDPELLTLKAVRILKEVSCICVPKGREEGISLALSVVKKAVDIDGKEIIEAYFPMRKTRDSQKSRRTELETKWNETIKRVLSRIEKGIDVAFITLGDPTIYSTFFYLADKLLEVAPQIKMEIIPGVSSITTAAAKVNLSLGLGDEKIAILPATYTHDLRETMERFDTVVLMKVHSVFDNLRHTLNQIGLVDNAVYIARAGMEGEKIFKDIQQVKESDLDYFSVVIIKK